MDISSGVNSVSEEDPLKRRSDEVFGHKCMHAPHADEVLHHELVQGFRRVRHVNFALAIPEVRLITMSTPELSFTLGTAYLLHDVRKRCGMVEVETGGRSVLCSIEMSTRRTE